MIASPILALEVPIAGCAYRIAPEREEELGKWVESKGIGFQVNEDANFKICALPDGKTICLPVSAMEYLWAMAYFSLVSYEEMQLVQKSGDQSYDATKSSRSRVALELLSWAQGNITNPGKRAWPGHLPVPGTTGELLNEADELFLAALAWIVHHELSHIREQHSALDPNALANEHVADRQATEFVVAGCEEKGPRIKRLLGVGVALLAMDRLAEPSKPSPYSIDHPPVHERFSRCVQDADPEVEEMVFMYLTINLQLSYARYGVSADVESASWTHAFFDLLAKRDLIEKVTRSS